MVNKQDLARSSGSPLLLTKTGGASPAFTGVASPVISNQSLFAACGGGEAIELVASSIQSTIRERSRGRVAATEQKGEGVNCVGEVHFSIVIRIRGIRAGRAGAAQEDVVQQIGRVTDVAQAQRPWRMGQKRIRPRSCTGIRSSQAPAP